MKKHLMKRNMRQADSQQRKIAIGFYAATACSVAMVHAEGFRDATTGAFDLGRSGGRIAHVDDATAVQNNPANLVDVTNVVAELDPSIIYINVNYQAPNGQSASSLHPLKVLPNFFMAAPILGDKLTFGFGVTVPFGLANQWPTESSAFARPNGTLGTSAANFGKLTTFNFNPTLAFKPCDTVQIGVGLDVMYSELEFRQFLSPLVPNLEAHASGDGVGVGGNLGVTWNMTDRQRLAFTYRSTMTVDYSGNTDIENTGVPSNPTTSFDSQVKYPNIFSAGYGIDLTDTIRLESDLEWIQFSQFKNLPIRTGTASTIYGPINLTETVPQAWHNTFTLGFGGDWKFADHWVVRGGYQYFESPVPNSTFSPLIPDADQNVITMGLGWHAKNVSLEFAYGLDFYNDRNIDNPATSRNYPLNGKYTFNVHLFSLAFRYAF
jgi:long-chain fatty acid transport protein